MKYNRSVQTVESSRYPGGKLSSCWILLSTFLFLCLSNVTVFAQVFHKSDFDTGEFESFGWVRQGAKKVTIEKDSLTKPAPVCSNDTAKFVINFNDSFNYRTQLALLKGPASELKAGGEYWLGFSVFLPTSWKPDFAEDVIWDLHGVPDLAIGEGYRRPILALRTVNDEWIMTYSKDSKSNSGPQGSSVLEQEGRFKLGLFETGKWTKFVVHMKYSFNSDGFVKVYKNKNLVATKNNGIGYNDIVGPYLLIGLYKRTWDLAQTWGKATNVSSRTLYFDEIKFGDANSSLDEVSPSCINEPSGGEIIRK